MFDLIFFCGYINIHTYCGGSVYKVRAMLYKLLCNLTMNHGNSWMFIDSDLTYQGLQSISLICIYHNILKHSSLDGYLD